MEAKVKNLKALLDIAMRSLVVMPNNARNSLLDVDTYIGDLRQTSSSGRQLRSQVYTPSTTDPEAKFKLLEIIRHELRDYLHNDRTIPMAGLHVGHAITWGGYSIEAVLGSILRTSIVVGTSSAAKRFFQCIESNQGRYYEVNLLGGIKIEDAFRLSEQARLEPLPSKQEDYAQYMHDRIGDRKLFQRGQTLLVIEKVFSPVFFRPNQADRALLSRTVEDDSKDSCAKELSEALALVCDSPVRHTATWRYIREDEISKVGFVGFSQEFHETANADFTSISKRMDYKADSSNIDEAMRAYSVRRSLDGKVKEPLQVVIDRWMSSKVDRDEVHKAIDIGVALESLYTRGISDELRFRMSAGGAWHLGQTRDDRKELRGILLAIYNVRNKAVHQGKLPSTVNDGGGGRVPPNSLISSGQDLCRRAILKVIEDGVLPETDELILGR